MPTCYHCKSPDVKKLSAIIAQGTKEIDLGHGFLGIGGSKKGGIGIGGARGRSKGKIKNSLVTRMERQIPKQPGMFKILVFAFLGFFFIKTGWDETDAYGFLIMIGFGVLYFVYSLIKKRKKYPSELSEFKKTWYCYSCDKFSLSKK